MLLVSTQTLHAALYRSTYSLLTWSCLGTLQGFLVCYCECGSPSVPVTSVSWMLSVSTQALHAALYRSIYSLLTWSCLGTLQGFLVCYCECGSPSVPVTAVSWMLSVSTQTLHAALYRSMYSVLTWSSLFTLQGFLGALQNSGDRILALSYLIVCPSVRMEQLGLHWRDFHEILYFCGFRKSREKTQVSWKSDNNNGYFNCRTMWKF